GGMDLGRSAMIHVEGPLSDIEMMRSHVRKKAAGVFAIGAKGWEVIVDADGAVIMMECAGRRRTVRHLPIDARWRLFGRHGARPSWSTDSDAHRSHPADASAADIFNRSAEVAAELGTLLAAGLKYDVVVTGSADHGPCFVNGE